MRRWLANVLCLGGKEFRGLLGDSVLVFFIVYAFSVDVYSVATGVQTDVSNASIAVVDGDRSQLSARLADALLPPHFRQPPAIDRSQVDAAMDLGRHAFVLDIPAGFEADILRGRPPALQLAIDATAMTQAGVGGGYVSAIVEREIAAFLAQRGGETPAPVRLAMRNAFNPNLEGRWFQAVAGLIEQITMMAILLVGAAVIREREHGTIEHLLVMPLRASEIAAAKLGASGLVILLAAGLSLELVIRRVLAVPIEGSIALFLAGTALYLFAITSLGLLLSTLARSMPQFTLLVIPVFLIINMLSGATTPVQGMPDLLQSIVQVSPTVHYVLLAQAILYRAADFEIVWPQMAILLGLGIAFLAVSLARFRTMLAQHG